MTTNPLKDLSIFFIFDPQNRLNLGQYKAQSCIITLGFSSNGVCKAFIGHSDMVLARSGGCGYDKESQTLSLAIEKITGLDIGCYGFGIETIKRKLKDFSIILLGISDLSSHIDILLESKNPQIKRLAKGIKKELQK